MRRVAWFHTVIETDDELTAQLFLTTVNEVLDRIAHAVAEQFNGELTVVSPMESGQSIPVGEKRPRDPACVERWPECESGLYDPRCCRFPKSCSCEVLDVVGNDGV